MAMLSSKLALGDVADVEALARRALDDGLRRLGARLKPDLYEEALSAALERSWKLWLEYDPALSLSFSSFAYRRLSYWWLVDWYRKEFGDSRYEKNLAEDGSHIILESLRDEDSPMIESESWFEVVEKIQSTDLSPRAQWTLETFGWAHWVEKHTQKSLAASSGVSARDISLALKELRKEIEARCLTT